MAWRHDVLSRLAGLGASSERSMLVALWELWRTCDVTIKNLFEQQRLEIRDEAARRRFEPLSTRGDLHLEFFQLEDWDLVRELGVLTAQLDQREAQRLEWTLRSVQPVA